MPEAAGASDADRGPAPAHRSWPLTGCRADSLADLFSPRTVAELARVAAAAGGAVVLELGGNTLRALAGGRRGMLHLLEGLVPPVGLHSLALRNGTLALLPGMGVAFASTQPFAVSLERIKVTRPAPIGGSGAGSRAVLAPGGGIAPMVAFSGAVSGRMVQCRVELSPAGPAGCSVLQVAMGVCAQVWPGGVLGGGVACRVAGGVPRGVAAG
jgi:hypothetical protein